MQKTKAVTTARVVISNLQPSKIEKVIESFPSHCTVKRATPDLAGNQSAVTLSVSTRECKGNWQSDLNRICARALLKANTTANYNVTNFKRHVTAMHNQLTGEWVPPASTSAVFY